MRMRFKPAERAVYLAGVAVEWRVGRYWYPGEILTGTVVNDNGYQHILVRNLNRGSGGGIVRYGEVTQTSPESVRIPKS